MGSRRVRAICGIIICFASLGQGRAQPGSEFASREELRPSWYELWLGDRRLRVDIHSEASLRQLVSTLTLELKETAAAAETDEPDGEEPAYVERRIARGLKQMVRVAQAALESPEPETRRKSLSLLLEALMAVNNAQRSPVPTRLDAVQGPGELVRRLSSPVGHGTSPATNLRAGPQSDLSRLEPESSTFWARPADIPAQNLYAGFGRPHKFAFGDRTCTYASAKESYGLNPGFEVNCDGTKVKLKFAELHSEPFATRVFDALGYHTDPTDFVPEVKVRYDRRIFLEFNSRRELSTRLTLFGVVPVYRLKLQQHFDPFNYIASAVLRDGRRWSGAELKRHLLRPSSGARPETDPANFRPEIEKQIDFLVTVAANAQPKQRGIKSIGPWDFGQLDHASRRELRGAGLLAAWLGWFDTRFDNTRLRTVKRGGKVELEHFFSDLGGVLGETSGWLFARGEQPDVFPWTFTRPPLWQGPHRLARPLRLTGYKPIAPSAAFAEMTLDDARWMARLIAQLTETQIVQALVASGLDSAEVRLYTEKLISRRDRMLVDLGLDNEFPLCRARGIDRNFTYDPVINGPVVVAVPGGGQVQAPVQGKIVKAGKLARAESPVRTAERLSPKD